LEVIRLLSNLENEMRKKQITVKDLALLTGNKSGLLRAKLREAREFTWGEMRVIKAVFPDKSLAYLFDSRTEPCP
jgi:hypothetical protein